MTETKSCTKCLETKTTNLFYLQRGKPRGMCKECSKKQNIKNPNHSINNNKYYTENKEKISKKAHDEYLKRKSKMVNEINKFKENIKEIPYTVPDDIEIDGETFQTLNDSQFDRFILEGQLKEKQLELFGLENNLTRRSTQRYGEWIDFLEEKYLETIKEN